MGASTWGHAASRPMPRLLSHEVGNEYQRGKWCKRLHFTVEHWPSQVDQLVTQVWVCSHYNLGLPQQLHRSTMQVTILFSHCGSRFCRELSRKLPHKSWSLLVIDAYESRHDLWSTAHWLHHRANYSYTWGPSICRFELHLGPSLGILCAEAGVHNDHRRNLSNQKLWFDALGGRCLLRWSRWLKWSSSTT